MLNKLAIIFLVFGSCLGFVGCKSPPLGAKNSLAWVEITGHSSREITLAAKEVLAREGYRLGREEADELTFEKPGSAWNEVAHGNWGEGMTVRLRLFISPQIEGG